jgi:hypothetical protein
MRKSWHIAVKNGVLWNYSNCTKTYEPYWFRYYVLFEYVNDLPEIICDLCKPIFFADDTSIIISDKDPTNFKIKIYILFGKTNEGFATNQITINYEKNCFLQFQTKSSKTLDIQVSYLNNQISSNSNVSFWD